MRRALVAVLLLCSCSIQKLAVNKLGDAMAAGGSTFSADDDPELIGDALPFTLKFIESLLAESPRHRGLLLAATRGFTQYSYGWVDLKAAELQSTDYEASAFQSARAKRLYVRARDYGLRGLGGTENALRASTREDVPLLYWTAAAWALAISKSKDDPESVADLPVIDALIRRARQLEPDFDSGAIDAFLVSYEMARNLDAAAAEKTARMHFQRAVELSGGNLASPFVALAESVDVPKQNRAEFRELLGKALEVDINRRPEWRLQNVIAQRRAAWLLRHIDDWFLEGEE
jgi:predicted anti-sigma-YlaC factor YlaD